MFKEMKIKALFHSLKEEGRSLLVLNLSVPVLYVVHPTK